MTQQQQRDIISKLQSSIQDPESQELLTKLVESFSKEIERLAQKNMTWKRKFLI